MGTLDVTPEASCMCTNPAARTLFLSTPSIFSCRVQIEGQDSHSFISHSLGQSCQRRSMLGSWISTDRPVHSMNHFRRNLSWNTTSDTLREVRLSRTPPTSLADSFQAFSQYGQVLDVRHPGSPYPLSHSIIEYRYDRSRDWQISRLWLCHIRFPRSAPLSDLIPLL